MHDLITKSAIVALLHIAMQIALVIRALLRPHREPASRVAWIVVILSVPVAGMIAYILFGEVSIGRKRVERARRVVAALPRIESIAGMDAPDLCAKIPSEYEHSFRVARSINGFEPIGGNSARLMEDSNAAIASMVADIDAATDHVHLIFYIWLNDHNGRKMAEALQRAAARGVVCRAMADGLGSRDMIRSALWRDMKKAGVRLAVALPIGNPLLRPLHGRIDLRNHRKILVIDNRVTYCGSQNCADPEFLVKAKYAPWVDAVARFEGPIARQNQLLFASDWNMQLEDDVEEVLLRPVDPPRPGFTAIAFGTGPTVRYSAMPEMFETLLYTARRKLVITTPYYVPTESMQDALCSAARRGVDTTIVFPARNDSFIVAAASRSYYGELLEAGVRVLEFRGGLLHTKSMTIDDAVTLIGSANMDRRSFELNYENNILVADEAFNAEVRRRQDQYLASSRPVALEEVRAWPLRRQLWNNTIAMLGPLL